MPSVIEAAMNKAEARNSFSPPNPWNRFVGRIQMNNGILTMRVKVIELGRFTGHTANLTRLEARKPALPNYPPLRRAKAIKVKEIVLTQVISARRGSKLRRLRFCSGISGGSFLSRASCFDLALRRWVSACRQPSATTARVANSQLRTESRASLQVVAPVRCPARAESGRPKWEGFVPSQPRK